MQPVQWRKNPRPDPSVIEFIDQLAEAARRGQIRLIGVVIVDPMLNVEPAVAGDLDAVKARLLAAGHNEAAIKLLASLTWE